MRTYLGALAAIVILTTTRVAAFNEPDGFRGVPWGASEDTLRKELGSDGRGIVSCYSYPAERRWLGDRSCFGSFLLGDVKIDATYSFRDGRFVRVNLTFRSAEFDRVTTAFLERYGAPTEDQQRPYKTQGGLESVNRTLAWTGPNVAIALSRYGTKITEGFAMLMTQEERRESSRLRQEQMKGAGKGL